MKRILFLLATLPAFGFDGLPTTVVRAQSVKPAAINEDYSWNLPTEAPRLLRYRPAGNGVEITDGTQRFNRALYGAHTGFRMECSDQPEFGLYLPRMGGNLRFDVAYGHRPASSSWVSPFCILNSFNLFPIFIVSASLKLNDYKHKVYCY